MLYVKIINGVAVETTASSGVRGKLKRILIRERDQERERRRRRRRFY
jgi:hypothetical protein